MLIQVELMAFRASLYSYGVPPTTRKRQSANHLSWQWKILGGPPSCVRTDRGAENVLVWDRMEELR